MGVLHWEGWNMVAAIGQAAGAMATAWAVWYAYRTQQENHKAHEQSKHDAIEPILNVHIMRPAPRDGRYGLLVSVENLGLGPAVYVKVRMEPEGEAPVEGEFEQQILYPDSRPNSNRTTGTHSMMVHTFEWERRGIPMKGRLLLTYKDRLGKPYTKQAWYYLKDGDITCDLPN